MSSSNKGIIINKAKENKNNGVGSSFFANFVKTNAGPSGGTSIIEKKYVTKMKSLTNRLVQAHEVLKQEADKDWVM